MTFRTGSPNQKAGISIHGQISIERSSPGLKPGVMQIMPFQGIRHRPQSSGFFLIHSITHLPPPVRERSFAYKLILPEFLKQYHKLVFLN